jgi:hypothetical protein
MVERQHPEVRLGHRHQAAPPLGRARTRHVVHTSRWAAHCRIRNSQRFGRLTAGISGRFW